MDQQGNTVTTAQWRTMGASNNKNWENTGYDSSWSNDYCVIKLPTFTNGRMMVQNPDGRWGFIDEKGTVMGAVKWDYVSTFTDGMAVVRFGGLYGFIDMQGKQIGQVVWKQMHSFSNGLAAVQDTAGRWGFINKQNELVIPCRYTEVSAFRDDGTCDVKTAQGTWVVIDKTGEVSFFGH